MKFKRNKIGQFSKSDYQIKKRTEKIKNILIIELALLLTGILVMWSLSYDALVLSITPKLNPIQVLDPQSNSDMTVYDHICKASNGQNCDILYNLMRAENSNLDENAQNENANGTTDHSYYQINDVHIIGNPYSKGQGTITMPCVYDLYCSTRWVNEKLKAGQLHIWVASTRI